MVMEIEMSDFDGVRDLLYGGPIEKPRFNAIISCKRVGRAGVTKTQKFLRKKSPKQMPKWYWEMVENRPSWKNATDHQLHLNSVALVMDPPTDLEPVDGELPLRAVSIGFTTA
jgi:hypothetical protein